MQYTDISLDFETINPLTGDIGKLNNISAIRKSVKNLLLTKQESIPFNRHKGSIVDAALFEQSDIFLRVQIESEVQRVLSYYEPRVRVLEVKVNTNRNELTVNIIYEIVGDGTLDEVQFEIGQTK